jgi:hypothetical protein
MIKVSTEHEVYQWRELTRESQKKAMIKFFDYIVKTIPEIMFKELYLKGKRLESHLLRASLSEQLYEDYKEDEQTLRKMNEAFYYKDGSIISEELNIKAHQMMSKQELN